LPPPLSESINKQSMLALLLRSGQGKSLTSDLEKARFWNDMCIEGK